MKVGKRLAGAALAAAVLVFSTGVEIATGARSAKIKVQPPRSSALAYLGEHQGYDIAIAVPSPNTAVLYALKIKQSEQAETGGPNYSQSSYAVRARNPQLRQGVVRARFGSLGHVALRFHPNGKTRLRRPQPYCRGRRPITEYGTFRGTVSLEGEEGYFRRRISSATGTVHRSFRLECKPGRASNSERGSPLSDYVTPSFGFFYSSGDGTIAQLNAAARFPGRSVGIRASHRAGSPPGAEVQVGVLEAKPGMAIGRSALVNGEAGTLTTSLPGIHPAFATLAPPAPFHGEAKYFENSSKSHSWTGSLGVSLPGLDLPLVGPGFYTSLCVLSPLKSPGGCDFAKPKPLVPEQGAALAVERAR